MFASKRKPSNVTLVTKALCIHFLKSMRIMYQAFLKGKLKMLSAEKRLLALPDSAGRKIRCLL